jgi:hypothetical protein
MKNGTILEIELFLQRLIHKYDRALVTLVQDGRNNASVNNRQNPYQILLLPFAF